MQKLLCLRYVVQEGPILQIGNDRIPPSWRGIKAKDLSDLSVDDQVGDVLDENLPLNWNSVATSRLVSELA